MTSTQSKSDENVSWDKLNRLNQPGSVNVRDVVALTAFKSKNLQNKVKGLAVN